MTIKLDIPFLPDAAYTDFLAEHLGSIHGVYFSLFITPAVDARYPWGPWQGEDLRRLLPRLPGLPKYALLNSRFYHPDHYFDTALLNGLAARLETLADAGLLDGVVFADFYLLKALGRRRAGLAAALEAVPSVNVHIDSPRKLRVCLEMIAASGFRPPRKIILDRSLNRQPGVLARLAAVVHDRHPRMAVGLLANEGCLPDCPFKPAHDAHLAFGNMRLARENTYALNTELGCLEAFRSRPERIFQSPFIRPEDVDRYAPAIAFVKLGGRTLGTGFLRRAIRAYIARRWDGNLLELMDTMEALAAFIHVAGDALPEDFHERMTTCTDDCRECGYCRQLARRVVRPVPLQLPDFRRPA
jgi:collagenase-like PrtC family protease